MLGRNEAGSFWFEEVRGGFDQKSLGGRDVENYASTFRVGVGSREGGVRLGE